MPRKTRSGKSLPAAAKQKKGSTTHVAKTKKGSTNASLKATIDDISCGEEVAATARMPQVEFVESNVESRQGDQFDCMGCDRPNDVEQYMVQCHKCSKSYHFSCAQTNGGLKDRTDLFTCISCTSRPSAPAPSSIAGLSSTSSTRRARLARELELLEEARRMEEDTQREQLERERQLNEKAAREKIERDKQYLARKRELLIQQDEEDDVASLRSHRSKSATTKRVENWVVEQVTSKNGSVIQEAASASAYPPHRTVVDPKETRPQQLSSTPIHEDPLESNRFPLKGEPVDIDLISAARTTGSITIGDNELDEAIGGNQINTKWISPVISLVDLKPLENLLVEPNPTATHTGTLPKVTKSAVMPYSQWQSETGFLRRAKELAELHEKENEVRRKRELELVDQIKLLQIQRGADEQQLRKNEAEMRQQLQQLNDRQSAMELQRQQELQQRDAEIHRLREAEQQLKAQICSLSQVTQRNPVSEIQPSITMQIHPRTTQRHQEGLQPSLGTHPEGKVGIPLEVPVQPTEPTNDPALVSAIPPVFRTINATPPHLNLDHQFSNISTPIGGRSTYSDHASNTTNHPPIHTNVPPQGDFGFAVPRNWPSNGFQQEVFHPTPQQLAARQVLSKELPIFAGDPIDWPLFVSSYRHSTEACGYSDFENLLRLQRALKGAAKDAVSSFLLHPSTVSQVLSTLQTLFGRPEQIVHTLIEKVRATPAPKPDRLETLVTFGLVVQNLCGHLKAVGLDWHLSNPTLLHELVDKLPANVKFNWAMYQQQFAVVDLNVFCEYMSRVTSATSSITLLNVQQKYNKDDRAKAKEKAFVNAHAATAQREPIGSDEEESSETTPQRTTHATDEKAEKVKKCPACNTAGHQASDCSKFKELSLDERWKLVKDCKLCRRCLTPHLRWPCKAGPCGFNGCQKLHHQLLHFEPNTESKQSDRSTNATVTMHQKSTTSMLFRVLPVTLYGKHGEVNTFAFLDDGSQVTLIERGIAKTLGLDGHTESLFLQWTGGINKGISDARMVQMEISAQGSNKRFRVGEAYTVDGLGLPQQSLNFEEIANRFKYLRKLPVQSFQSATPGILIGLDNVHLLATLKLREGRIQEPVASKTRIGWAVYGRIQGGDRIPHRQVHVCARSSLADLHEYVREFFTLENLGITTTAALESVEEQRARKILEDSTVRTNCGKFETGLLWKHDYIELPDSQFMAEKRLECLEKRLQKNEVLYEAVRRQISEFKLKGFVHEATKDELDSFDLRRTWYLPLGVVQNPNKPGKIRLIWDAAAKVDGTSLNDNLLTGPDLLTPLLAVMFQFREREVAISADIMEMFLQILIRPKDRSALLFLWRDTPHQEMKVMVTNVAIFGATCSPVQSQFVKNLNATEYEGSFPRASAAIKHKHYVDDYLDSVDTIDEAVELATDVTTVHGKADFLIRNWRSNKVDVLERIGEVSVATSKQFTVGKEINLERVLGMIWIPDEDVFSFNLCLRENVRRLIAGDVIPSKREVLSVVMSIYDPLGLVAAFVIHGKVIIQDTWREKIGWDDKIPPEVYKKWKQWLEMLTEMSKVKISRCYFPGYDPISYNSLQLHIFVDASAEAYSAVAYFRIVDKGQVRCSLVASKTKVAPLQGPSKGGSKTKVVTPQPLSIPRLELMAAMIGARLRKTVEDYHSVKITRTVLWSDSTTVMAWINSDSRRYRQFVAFRVNEILSLTSTDEWRWIGTRANVADEATKWGKGPSTDSDSRWYRGPAFLYEPGNDWIGEKIEDTNEELRPSFVCSHFLVKPMIDFARFSKFERLRRCVAYVHRYLDNLHRSVKGLPRQTAAYLEQEELQKAEQTLWRLAQSEAYPDEVAALRRNKETKSKELLLERSSKIATMSPTMDDQGVLRVDGRMEAAEFMHFDAKYPIILPREHRLTDLLLDWYHCKYRHANEETVLNEIRQKFFVSKLRTCLRKTKTRCMWCRVYKSVPVPPKMGPLPKVRLTPFVRAFTFVGIDYFGPYLVKVGRSVAKRWGVVFTCLTVRAIHIEVANSLSADSCKKAIRRFIARRGAPQEIYSDNGTNFIGVSRELAKELTTINKELGSSITDTYTKWRFNPPSAPHMGGCWERMVRSIKTALGVVPTDRKLDDESLATMFLEAENMINSRPLTFVSLEASNAEAITPNHFLLLSSTGVQQPVKLPVDEKQALRNSWDMIQLTLDRMWRRWITEYLPTITRRTKWFNNVRPITEGELVVIADEKVRNRWLRGRVVRTYAGKDGIVRKADVMTTGGILNRAIAKLALLDVESKDDAGPEVQAT